MQSLFIKMSKIEDSHVEAGLLEELVDGQLEDLLDLGGPVVIILKQRVKKKTGFGYKIKP